AVQSSDLAGPAWPVCRTPDIRAARFAVADTLPRDDMEHLDDRPWDRPGSVRRDCEPHRGPFLNLVGTVSLLCGICSLCTLLPGLIGLPLGLATWVMARNDFRKMEAGLMAMDPAKKAEHGTGDAASGTVFHFLLLRQPTNVPV